VCSSDLVLGVRANQGGTYSVTVRYEVLNNGSSSISGGWYDVGYLSTDGALDNADVTGAALNYRALKLDPGASYVQESTFTSSVPVAGGRYSFFVKTDGRNPALGGTNTDKGRVTEVYEANNVARVTVNLDADLVIGGVVVEAVTANANGSYSIRVKYRVTNMGTTAAATASWYDVGYLSADDILDNADQSNSYLWFQGTTLLPGAFYERTATYATAAGTVPGTYTFFVKADGNSPAATGGQNTDNGRLSETDEANNIHAVQVKLDADLRISDVVVQQVTANVNGSYSISVKYKVTNAGTMAAASNGWYDVGYLSADGVLDNADQSNGYLWFQGTTLLPGASYEHTKTYTTSANTAAGTYTFFVKADGNAPATTGGQITDAGRLKESDEANNVFAVPVTLGSARARVGAVTTQPPPQLHMAGGTSERQPRPSGGNTAKVDLKEAV
jgi:hypothetical protein